MPSRVYDNRYICWNGRPTDAGDKSRSLRSLLPDADGFGLARHTRVANIDVVIACGEIEASVIPQRYVEASGCVVKERIKTVGCVVVAGCVVKKRAFADCCVTVTGHVAKERPTTDGRIVIGGCVASERIKTDRRVVAAGRIANERIIALNCVV